MNPGDRIEVTGEPGCIVRATVIHVFERDSKDHLTAAPTLRNMALTIFNSLPASKVALISTERPTLLFLVEAAHRWFDVTAQPVRITVANRQSSRPQQPPETAPKPTEPAVPRKEGMV